MFLAGVMTVETIVGRRPYTGRTAAELLSSVAAHGFHLPGAAAEILRLDAVLRRSLAPDPAARFASVAEMRRDLVEALLACPPLPAAAPPDDQQDTRTMGFGAY